MTYAFSRLTADDRNFNKAFDALRADNQAALGPAELWGAFHGLFGVASNELIVVTYGAVADVNDAIAATPGVVSVDTLLLEPTVRPTKDEPRTREGLYVFRFFDVAHKHVDEIAALSFEAWKDFEVMARRWAKRHPTICIHPGWPAIADRSEVVESWRRILANPDQPGIDFYNAKAQSVGSMVFVTCYEELPGSICVATNGFVNERGG